MPEALHAIVTLGPTHEPIDEVRFLGNRSSGRMGVEIARALQAQGCRVTVLAGPCRPDGLDSLPDVRRFRTAEELRATLCGAWPEADLLVMAAAVADWRPVSVQSGKLRRSDGGRTLELEQVPEILGSLTHRTGQFVVGFALEPAEELLASARSKLSRKRADCIVANPLATMDADCVDGTLVWADGRVETPGPRMSKAVFARWLVDRVLPAAAARAGR
jgi:phosphopantothenoylcysteine decarboxylase/phosphopantothenate--cysteine ligase